MSILPSGNAWMSLVARRAGSHLSTVMVSGMALMTAPLGGAAGPWWNPRRARSCIAPQQDRGSLDGHGLKLRGRELHPQIGGAVLAVARFVGAPKTRPASSGRGPPA